MKEKQYTKQIDRTLCSIDGEEWFEISEISALCAINDHYLIDNLEGILESYNKGHIIPVGFVMYKKA